MKGLKEVGWIHTYNWVEEIFEKETMEDTSRFSELGRKVILKLDIVIILLLAGCGTLCGV
ncbi:MAG: hypothetical protein MR598_04890 [Erysipelotrichaceae bacterium]|nr:hypothetical protein [Erysipelotrichaceae bacterium]